MAGWTSLSVEAYWEPHALAAVLGWGPAFCPRYMTHCMVPAGPDAPSVSSLSCDSGENCLTQQKKKKKKKITRWKEILLMIRLQGPENVKINVNGCLPASSL